MSEDKFSIHAPYLLKTQTLNGKHRSVSQFEQARDVDEQNISVFQTHIPSESNGFLMFDDIFIAIVNSVVNVYISS